MDSIARIIGISVAEVIASEFRKAPAHSGPPGIRVAGFQGAEIRHLVDRLRAMKLRIDADTEPVCIVVGSRRPQEGVPPELLLQDDWTLTRHRHGHENGVILIQVDPQSDETGIMSMYALEDGRLLNEGGDVTGRIRQIGLIAWQAVEPNNPIAVPEPLIDGLLDVFRQLSRFRRPSLRTWVEYCVAVARRLVGKHAAVAGHTIREVLGNELGDLSLFPDPQLLEKTSALGRRLERNYHMSELRGPQGTILPDERLGELIDTQELLGGDEKPLPIEVSDELRRRMRGVLEIGGPTGDHSVDVQIWEQLFEKRRLATGLGTQIQIYLEQHHGARVAEYDALEVRERLDDGESEAAREFLDADPPQGELPLVDCLTPGLRKKLDRLAFEGERGDLTDPLIALLYGLNAMEWTVDGSESRTVRLEWEKVSHDAVRSARLFAFFYRAVLQEIVETCNGEVGVKFELDEFIDKIPNIEELFAVGTRQGDPDDDEEAQSQREWGQLRFKLVVTDSRTPLIRFRWDPREVPGLVAFAFLTGQQDSCSGLQIPKLDDWCDQAFNAVWSSSTSPAPKANDELLRLWDEAREEHYRQWRRAGLSVAGLDEYLDVWTPLLQQATERYVPAGGAVPALDEFLDRDTARTSDQRFVMLATHPLRLRWLRHHLNNLASFITKSLLGQLRLNPENDQVYFQWIKRVSPHRQPPVMSPAAKLLATAVREVQMHEEYALVPSGDDKVPEWLGALDDVSIDELVATTRSFLAAFPWKLGGLSVLLLATSGAANIAKKFVERLRHRELASLDLELHVATTAADHGQVAEALAALDSEEGRGRGLFPPFRLVLHVWEGGSADALSELEGRMDLALAPNLFGLHSTVLEETRHGAAEVGGHFDPWLDPATAFRPSDGQTINVSQVLLPVAPDPLLQNWSTLTVRRRRQAPVSAGDPTAIDFVTLQVAFDKHEALFARLHEIAHWVITLDPFIGRDQIDALANAPDVIVVKSGVGKNESNTLVVSSAAGKTWITRQFAKRLIMDFGLDEERAGRLAIRLYDIGRHVVPGLMLRAVGLGRATEEILGLILARYALDNLRPLTAASVGMEYWLSLDEYAEWFGGAHGSRPDLLRVRLIKAESGTRLELTVLESKFRRSFDSGAEKTAYEQIGRGVRLFDGAFTTGTEVPADAKFWRRELLNAVSQLSRRPADPANLPARRVISEEVEENFLLDDLRSGSFEFKTTDAIVCLTGWEVFSEAGSTSGVRSDREDLLRLDRTIVLRLLDRIEGGLRPMPSDVAQSDLDHGNAGLAKRDEGRITEISPSPSAASPPVESTPRDMGPPPDQATTSQPTGRRGISEQVLESRYAHLLAKLDQLRVDVQRPTSDAFRQGPGFCLYRVVPRTGIPVDRVTGKLEDIKLALELPAELNIRTYLDRGAVVFEVPKEDSDRYYVTTQDLWVRSSDRSDALSAPIGEDIDGDVVELDFSSSDTPHLLIAGQTGSGKSIALETILLGLCQRKSPEQLRLFLIDPKGTELVALADDPHTEGEIGWGADEAVGILVAGVAEMNRRYGIFRTVGVRTLPEYNAHMPSTEKLPWWLLVLDEYADLTADPDDRKRIEIDLKRVAQKGRAAGVHLIVATQKPSAEVISTVIRSNLPAQLALRVKSSTDSRIILEETGAESLAGKGDAFLRTARGLRRVQCGLVSRTANRS